MKKLIRIIKKTPLIGPIYCKIRGVKPFISSENYWEERYKRGGNSGAGSYNELAVYKAEIINQFVKEKNILSVIEFGCGDGNQLQYFNFDSYIGYDVSETIIANCRNKFTLDKSKKFDLLTNYAKDKADLVLSLDVIYHLVEDEVYDNYMQKLFSASNKYVIIYSSNADDHANNNIAPHVKHRKFTSWIEKNAPHFSLMQQIPNKYPFNGNNDVSSYADFYIYSEEKLHQVIK